MNIVKALQRAYRRKKEKGWKKLYWMIDLHDCIIPGTYTLFNDQKQFFPYAEYVLQVLTQDPDTCLILWTSSHIKPINEMLEWFRSHKIEFSYVNENPECERSELCDFSSKFYFDIGLDDKFGFEPDDWYTILMYLESKGFIEQFVNPETRVFLDVLEI